LLLNIKNKNIVLTPNEKEFNGICNHLGFKYQENFFKKVDLAKSISKKLGVVLCIKGRRDIITDGKRLKVTYAGEPVMSTAGCGDALSGLIISFMAETNDLFNAATAGTFLAGRAGDIAFSKAGDSKAFAG
jgi:NAD(P)H-hydrate epimerase